MLEREHKPEKEKEMNKTFYTDVDGDEGFRSKNNKSTLLPSLKKVDNPY